MKVKFVISTLLNSVLISFIANSLTLIKSTPQILFAMVPLFLFINIFAGMLLSKPKSKKVNVCKHGTVLLYAFYISIIASAVFHIWLWSRSVTGHRMTFVWSAVLCFAVNFVVFWNGIICVYLTSNQLGVKWRTIGILCGMIPVANLIVLYFILKTTTEECLFADYLLSKIPAGLKNKVAGTYNSALKKFGEENSDFLAAVGGLTDSRCSQLNAEMPAFEGGYCQSVGSVLKKARSGKLPLNFSYHLVKYFSGANDGLVSESSFEWGKKYTLLTPSGDRGISHGDMIDLNRENIPGFDVTEFYVQLVSELKNRGF